MSLLQQEEKLNNVCTVQWDYPLKSATPSNKITICRISIHYSLGRLTDLWICGREGEWFVIKRWQIFPTDAWHQHRFSWIRLELLGKGSNHLGKASSRNFSGFLSPVLPYLSSFSWHPPPTKAPSDPTSDEVHTVPLGVGNRWELFPKSGGFKDFRWFKTD